MFINVLETRNPMEYSSQVLYRTVILTLVIFLAGLIVIYFLKNTLVGYAFIAGGLISLVLGILCSVKARGKGPEGSRNVRGISFIVLGGALLLVPLALLFVQGLTLSDLVYSLIPGIFSLIYGIRILKKNVL